MEEAFFHAHFSKLTDVDYRRWIARWIAWPEIKQAPGVLASGIVGNLTPAMPGSWQLTALVCGLLDIFYCSVLDCSNVRRAVAALLQLFFATFHIKPGRNLGSSKKNFDPIFTQLPSLGILLSFS